MARTNTFVRLFITIRIDDDQKLRELSPGYDSYAACVGEYFMGAGADQIPGCVIVGAEAQCYEAETAANDA